MNGSSKTRIDTLRIRVPASDARSAKALAMTVASRLAPRAGDLVGGKNVRARVNATPSMSRSDLADLIVNNIAKRDR